DEYFSKLCESEDIESIIEPHPNMGKFIAALTAKYPHESTRCPWAGSFDHSEGHCHISIKFSEVDKVLPFIVNLANELCLTCWDPKEEAVYVPGALEED